MSIKIIAAIGENNEIGKDNKLIWHLPKDLNFFRQVTLDNHILMGRKTFESLPNYLDRRVYIVLSEENLEKNFDVISYDSLERLLEYYYLNEEAPDLYVIGGASVYYQMLPYTDEMLLTEIAATCETADAFFPYFDKKEWNKQLIGSGIDNNLEYRRVRYTRRKKK